MWDAEKSYCYTSHFAYPPTEDEFCINKNIRKKMVRRRLLKDGLNQNSPVIPLLAPVTDELWSIRSCLGNGWAHMSDNTINFRLLKAPFLATNMAAYSLLWLVNIMCRSRQTRWEYLRVPSVLHDHVTHRRLTLLPVELLLIFSPSVHSAIFLFHFFTEVFISSSVTSFVGHEKHDYVRWLLRHNYPI